MAGPCELILITGFLAQGKPRCCTVSCACMPASVSASSSTSSARWAWTAILLAGLGASLDEIVNGSIFCACRMDQFEAALDEAQRLMPELLFVEASGLSDPTAIRTILEQGTRYPDIRYRAASRLRTRRGCAA